MSEIVEYLLDHYGHCDRDVKPRNLCYWGPGCLQTGWIGRMCPHWQPIEGEQLAAMVKASMVTSQDRGSL